MSITMIDFVTAHREDAYLAGAQSLRIDLQVERVKRARPSTPP
jgi:hypothetical protein